MASLLQRSGSARTGAGARRWQVGAGQRAIALTWLWLVVLGAVCLAETVSHTGARNGFLESSRPLYSDLSGRSLLPGDGYVSWIGQVPVLQDAESSVKQTAFFLGQQGPQDTGFLDRRAAYAYLAALVLPWLRWGEGAYAAFVAVNLAFWWAAAAAMYWLVRRRTGDAATAVVASFFVATGNGMIFMVGLPQSYVPAYASLLLLLALAEWLDAWRPPFRLAPWLLLGWGAGVAATIYFTHIAVTVFWWVYGLTRVPWRYLAAATLVSFGIGALWEVFGHRVAGLAFVTDNSALVEVAAGRWLQHLSGSWWSTVTFVRGLNVSGTLLGAFPLPWWPLATLGFAVSTRRDQEWSLAGVMAGLVPMLAMLPLLSLSRIAYFMYPAIYFLAAAGTVWLAQVAADWLARMHVPLAVARTSGAAVAALAVCLLVLIGNADLLGAQRWIAEFHHAVAVGR